MANDFVKVLAEASSTHRMHEDLRNAAYHFKSRVSTLDENAVASYTAPDIMAALTMNVFWLEACFNYAGAEKIPGWNECASFWAKKRAVFAHCDIQEVAEDRPFSSIAKLKAFRAAFAHGKPQTLSIEYEAEGTNGDIPLPRYPELSWEAMCTVQTVLESFDDVRDIWLLIANSVGIPEFVSPIAGGRGLSLAKSE